ncbi:hypothetical protein [Nocardia salmonicida]
MQRPTSHLRDRQRILVGVDERAGIRRRTVSHRKSRRTALPQWQEILDAVLGSVPTAAVPERHTLALWAGELAHIRLQAQDDFSVGNRLRAARIIRIIDLWIEIYVHDRGDVQVIRGETLGSLIDRIAEVGAELSRVKNVGTTAGASTPGLERELDRLAKDYLTLATLLAAGR